MTSTANPEVMGILLSRTEEIQRSVTDIATKLASMSAVVDQKISRSEALKVNQDLEDKLREVVEKFGDRLSDRLSSETERVLKECRSDVETIQTKVAEDHDQVTVLTGAVAATTRTARRLEQVVLTGNGETPLVSLVQKSLEISEKNADKLDALTRQRSPTGKLSKVVEAALEALPKAAPSLVGGLGTLIALFNSLWQYAIGYTWELILVRAGGWVAASAFIVLILLRTRRLQGG